MPVTDEDRVISKFAGAYADFMYAFSEALDMARDGGHRELAEKMEAEQRKLLPLLTEPAAWMYLHAEGVAKCRLN